MRMNECILVCDLSNQKNDCYNKYLKLFLPFVLCPSAPLASHEFNFWLVKRKQKMKNKYWSVFLHLKSGWQRSDSSPSCIFFKISYSSGKSCTAPVNPAVPSTPFSRGSHGSKLAGYSDTLHLYKKACEVPDPASYLLSLIHI